MEKFDNLTEKCVWIKMRDRDIKWTKYVWMSLLVFASFMLEYFSIFVIEPILYHADIWNYSAYQRSIHCIIMACMWALVVGAILHLSPINNGSMVNEGMVNCSEVNWGMAIICLLGCKVITFIDWHTFKVIGEYQGKSLFQFCSQYLYYIFK